MAVASLRDERVATLVQDAFLHFDGERYRLLAWVIMPNHVHVIIETMKAHSLSKVVHSWKSYTANFANRILQREGAFWGEDYFDRFIRNNEHFAYALQYVHNNPVKAGLCKRAQDWKFSSASWANEWRARDARAP
jgi:putative DNA methylase